MYTRKCQEAGVMRGLLELEGKEARALRQSLHLHHDIQGNYLT